MVVTMPSSKLWPDIIQTDHTLPCRSVMSYFQISNKMLICVWKRIFTTVIVWHKKHPQCINEFNRRFVDGSPHCVWTSLRDVLLPIIYIHTHVRTYKHKQTVDCMKIKKGGGREKQGIDFSDDGRHLCGRHKMTIVTCQCSGACLATHVPFLNWLTASLTPARC